MLTELATGNVIILRRRCTSLTQEKDKLPVLETSN